MSSGTKRTHRDRDAERDERNDRKEKPKDWRDAFLDEDESRRSRDYGRDRERDRDRDRDRSSRYGERDRRGYDDLDREKGGSSRGLDYRDRDRDSHRDQHRGKDRERERDSRRDRDRERDVRGDKQRHGDTKRNRDEPPRRKEDVTIRVEREEGEIEPSPDKQPVSLPSVSPGRSIPDVSPRRYNNSSQYPAQPIPIERAPFKPVNLPTGPRSRVPQTRPPPSNNVFESRTSSAQAKEEDTEPITVLEEETDPEKVLEERRRKREEIMAKFKANGGRAPAVDSTPGPSEGAQLGNGMDSVHSGGLKTGERTGLTTGAATGLLKSLASRSVLTPANAGTPLGISQPQLAPTPGGNDFDLAKHDEPSTDVKVEQTQGEDVGVGAEVNISAADYDPTADMRDDREKRLKDSDVVDDTKPKLQNETEPIVIEDEYEEVEIEEDEEEDDMDMFAAFGGDDQPKKKRKVTIRRLKNTTGGGEIVHRPSTAKAQVQAALDVVDNVDDTDGYYRITPGEVLDDGRYQVTINLGKGMFSAVVKAKVLKAVDQERRQDVVGKEVAIKVIRSQESMYVAGRKEVGILKRLNEADPEDKKHIVRMERTFEHRGHLCIVTESLSMNLRDVIKRFGKDVGLNMRAVRAYAHQLFLALSLMRKCSIVHADIKPDNVLVSENKATLKVCDLGSASDVTEGEITPYLVSRFYRAPEIILGLSYDTAIDIWSIGCTLYELYTGKILFPGRSNNQMLLLHMELKGKFNHRMIKKAVFGEMHFDEAYNFISIEKDKITGQDVAKTLTMNKAVRDLRARLLPPSSVQVKMKDDELKMMLNLVDLLDKCLQLDPVRRISPREALLHPFLAG